MLVYTIPNSQKICRSLTGAGEELLVRVVLGEENVLNVALLKRVRQAL